MHESSVFNIAPTVLCSNQTQTIMITMSITTRAPSTCGMSGPNLVRIVTEEVQRGQVANVNSSRFAALRAQLVEHIPLVGTD